MKLMSERVENFLGKHFSYVAKVFSRMPVVYFPPRLYEGSCLMALLLTKAHTNEALLKTFHSHSEERNLGVGDSHLPEFAVFEKSFLLTIFHTAVV